MDGDAVSAEAVDANVASTDIADAGAVRAALGRLAAISPFFAADVASGVDGAAPTAEESAPVPLVELYQGRPPLAAAVDFVDGRLGGVERRVAASTLLLGHAARLWSVALGCWVTSGVVPVLPAPRVLLTPGTAPARLTVADLAGWSTDSPDEATRLLRRVVVDGHLRPYVAALHAHERLATGLSWGNAASALVGTVRMVLGAWPPDAHTDSSTQTCPPTQTGRRRTVRRRTVRRVAADLLAASPLADTTRHAVDVEGGLDIASVVRRSCCLYYRVPGGGTCGDCPLGRDDTQ